METGRGMKKNNRVTTIIGMLALTVLALFICFAGYRVVTNSMEVPGKLSSVPVAANNLQHYPVTMSKVSKVDYEVMKYGYMDDVMLARMDTLDKRYEGIRMEEIRAVNNLTAMSEKTADKLAYEALKKEREEAEELARRAALLAEQAKKDKVRQIAEALLGGGQDNMNIDTGDSSDTGSGATASKGGKKGTPVFAETHGKSLGKFVITAYCTCRICCGVYSGGNRTASGTVPTTNRTIAVDTSVIPFGTKVVINGQVYVAEDRGGAIKGKRIDMFFYTHKEALRWGRRTMEVYKAD